MLVSLHYWHCRNNSSASHLKAWGGVPLPSAGISS
jgi:hypothetical protein